MTKVSVIIPTYNRAATVHASVQSALEQTYPLIEIIVVDDGSTDDTAERLSTYLSRINFLRKKNAGPSAARNHGARYANGDILAFLDSDDVWSPEKIARQVALMESYGNAMNCCVCNAQIIYGAGKNDTYAFDIARIESEHEEAVWKNPGEVLASRFLLFNQVAAIKRNSFVKVGGYNPRINLLEDHDLALKLASLDGVWGMIKTPMVVKSDETRGIGVECGKNPLEHARAQRIALTGVLESGLIHDVDIRNHIEKRLRGNARVIRNEEQILSEDWMDRFAGRMGRVQSSIGNFIARRRIPAAVTKEVMVNKSCQTPP